MYSLFKKFFLYGIWWTIGALTDLLFLYIFTEYAGFYYLISQVFSFIISFIVWFLFQKHITFRKKGGQITKQSLLFLLFQLIWISFNILIMRYLVEFMWVYYLLASIVAKIIIFVRNFVMNNKYNFK